MVEVLLMKLINSSFGSDNSLRNPASTAYAEVLAPHHGWAIRKAVAAGMYVLPTKAQLLARLNEDGECMKQPNWNIPPPLVSVIE